MHLRRSWSPRRLGGKNGDSALLPREMRGKCRDSDHFEGNGATLGRGGKSVESPEDFVKFGFSNALEAGCVVDVRTADGPVGLKKIDSLLSGVEGPNDWFHRAFNVAPYHNGLGLVIE